MDKELLQKIEDLISPVIEARGLELVEVEYKPEYEGKVLRIYIDKDNGVTLKDCEDISLMVGTILDTQDLILEHYTLEVSSPGIYRELKREKDFLKYVSNRIKVKTFSPIENQKVFFGKLLEYKDNKLKIELEYNNDILEIDKSNIAKVNLEPDTTELLKGQKERSAT